MQRSRGSPPEGQLQGTLQAVGERVKNIVLAVRRINVLSIFTVMRAHKFEVVRTMLKVEVVLIMFSSDVLIFSLSVCRAGAVSVV